MDGYERWVIELREGDARHRGGRAGQRIALPGGGEAELLAPYLGGRRLWAARLRLPGAAARRTSTDHGEPIRYRHQPEPRPLADYQTIFAIEPGSAEMPSAGRPFSERVLERLEERGDRGRHDRPAHRRLVARARRARRTRSASACRRRRSPPCAPRERVIAVGTTVVRALETAAAGVDARAGRGSWSSPSAGVRVVDGILTGWHEPDASHLLMLEAIAGRRLVERSYEAALADGYRWHEFGDSHLLLAG